MLNNVTKQVKLCSKIYGANIFVCSSFTEYSRVRYSDKRELMLSPGNNSNNLFTYMNISILRTLTDIKHRYAIAHILQRIRLGFMKKNGKKTIAE